MKTQKLLIDQIPAVVWGEPSDRVFLAVHGNLSNKEDTVIRLLAEEAALRGTQVISFDLPEHGERAGTQPPCKVQFCVRDLRKVMDYAKSRWQQVSLFACSMGAYFSLLEYREEPLQQALFLSPVVDMRRIIENMMTWFEVTEERLRELGVLSKEELPNPKLEIKSFARPRLIILMNSLFVNSPIIKLK